ncbi:MAG: nucleotidyltransferase family protein [Candidatus Poribacteria bacterium]
MRAGRVNLTKEQIAEFCSRNHIRKLAFFGSVLRDDFRADSDIDVLIEIEPGVRLGLFDIAKMELELSDMMGRKADLRTPQDLSKYFRDEVVSTAEVQYEKR